MIGLHLVSRVLLRAPLLPALALDRAVTALRRHPLGADALALASPELVAGLARGGKKGAARVALGRYARRAAYRPTPHGLLAGVVVGRLGPRTAIETTEPRAVLEPSWARLRACGRALLEDPAVRDGARLRTAPSLLTEGPEALWLGLAEAGLEVRHAEVDATLAAVLEVAADWAPWRGVRAAVAQVDDERDDDAIDDLLGLLLDQGILEHDLTPPLVGPAPRAWMRQRLDGTGAPAAQAASAALAHGARGLSALRAGLAALPGAASPDVHAVLVHGCARTPTLARAVVARAAALGPLLFRLQEAIVPPAAERALGTSLGEHLTGLVEVLGAGAYELGALATGEYGAALGVLDEPPPEPLSPEPPVLRLLVEALATAARAGQNEVALESAELEAALPPGDGPPSFELQLAPCRAPPRMREGTGWLLGLHAPAGASFGRFAHALGPPMQEALAELAEAEKRARPGERALDMGWTPSPALADLCVHPPARGRILALVGWPDGEAVRPADLDLVVDPASPEPLLLRDTADEVVRPSPLHRVRSTAAPGGIFRMLAGWSLWRQHAPWALSWGALAALPRLPRVTLDGFVIAPASWRVPDQAHLRGRALARWRAAGQVPAEVQVGEGDELLLLDLTAPGAAAALARHAGGRAFEIWPPLDRLSDAGGRRVEAIVAVVAQGAPAAREAALAAGRRAGSVPPPARRPPAEGWTTYKLFGAEQRQDALLLASICTLVHDARAAGEIDRWHFLRYVDPPGHRDHLRLRVRAPDPSAAMSFALRFDGALSLARETGDLISAETAEYFPEVARYGGPTTMGLVEALFELDSEVVLRLLAAEAEADEPLAADRVELAVRVHDALAQGLSLDLEARRQLASRRRNAHASALDADRDALDRDFRDRQRRLQATLSGRAGDPFSAALDAHATRVRALLADRPAEEAAALVAVLAPVMHLSSVRLLGPRPDEEAVAYLFWDRALEGLAARRTRGR